MKKIQPKTVRRITCPKCGELMLKIYPWSSLNIQEGAIINPCGKCLNNEKMFVPERDRLGYREI